MTLLHLSSSNSLLNYFAILRAQCIGNTGAGRNQVKSHLDTNKHTVTYVHVKPANLEKKILMRALLDSAG